MTPPKRIASTFALAAALAAGACNRNPADAGANAQASYALPALPATLPLEPGAATDLGSAPSVSDLPDAPPLKLARVADQRQAYGYADAAYSYDDALGEAAPDYAFDYDEVDPWAWQGYDDSLMVAEPIDDGYRYYYYRPGAAEPYFVRDPWYSYGYSDGLLAVVYAADGGIVGYSDYGPRLAYASRYYARGRALWGAARKGRRPVVAANWLRHRPVILAVRARWGEGRAHQPAWQAYYEANRPRQLHYWQTERVRRDADARRFADWQGAGFRTPPPPRALPPEWREAKWAKDQRRDRPAARQQGGARHEAGQRVADPRTAQREERRAARDERVQAGPAAARAKRAFPAAQAERRAELRTDPKPRPADHAARDRVADRTRPDSPRQPDRREAARAEQRQARPAERVDLAERRAAHAERQAERAQRREPDRTERRPDREPRRDADRAQQRQAEQAQRNQIERAQRQQAEQAQRQAEQAQRRQAEQAQRQQAEQAQRQAEHQQAAAAQRQQEQQQRQRAQPQPEPQQQRQQQRQERREARGPRDR